MVKKGTEPQGAEKPLFIWLYCVLALDKVCFCAILT